MKNQTVLVALVIAILFRNAVPVIDIFMVTLTFLLLTKREQMLQTSFIALGISIIASFIGDTPIGLFPLILSVSLFLFIILFKKLLDSGIHPVVVGVAFIATVIIVETLTKSILTTGGLIILPQTMLLIVWTCVALLLTTFAASFKQRI
ncbi:hypothetical protein IT418_01770 [bacterium]|nr:hypothetical protein [bacterium]